jgi:hypothetical protein
MQNFWTAFLIVQPLSGLFAYGLSDWLMRRRVSVAVWAVACFFGYIACSLATLLLRPDGRAIPLVLFGYIFGGAWARSNHLFPRRKGKAPRASRKS